MHSNDRGPRMRTFSASVQHMHSCPCGAAIHVENFIPKSNGMRVHSISEIMCTGARRKSYWCLTKLRCCQQAISLIAYNQQLPDLYHRSNCSRHMCRNIVHKFFRHGYFAFKLFILVLWFVCFNRVTTDLACFNRVTTDLA